MTPFKDRFACPRCGKPVKKNKVLQSKGGYIAHKDCIRKHLRCDNRLCRAPGTWDPYKRKWVCIKKCMSFDFSYEQKEYRGISRKDYSPFPHRDIKRVDFYKRFPAEKLDAINEAIRWEGKSPAEIIQKFQLQDHKQDCLLLRQTDRERQHHDKR